MRGIFTLFRRLFIFLSMTMLVVMSAGWLWFLQIWEAAGPQNEDSLLYILPGTNHGQLADQLHRENYLADGWLYPILRFGYSLVEGASFAPKAGEFLIPARASYQDLFRIIDTGTPYQHRMLITEGMRTDEVVQALTSDDRLSGAIVKYPAEGSLAPDTYFFVRDTNRADLLLRMQQRQEMILAEEWANRRDGLPYETAQEALVMASVIEKESGLVREQPLIASVFINRLTANMRLQSDASVLYGIIMAEGAAREIRKSDLKKDGPWNSYRRSGLPQTAIANPGRKAIHAALNPLPSSYFYFVADGRGGHNFSKTLDEHNRNVKAYRRLVKQRANKPSEDQ